MRYELYVKTVAEEVKTYAFIMETKEILLIFNYMENNRLKKPYSYVIIDNFPQSRVNYRQLGFNSMPDMNEHYQLIYECKITKYLEILEAHKDYNKIYEQAKKKALVDTKNYFLMSRFLELAELPSKEELTV